MNDILLQLSQNKSARSLIKTLGLPVPLPAQLRRADGPWVDRPLEGLSFLVHAGSDAALAERATDAVTAAGATTDPPSDAPVNGVIFDATGLEDPSALRQLYDLFHIKARGITGNGRVVVLGRPAAAHTNAAAAATAAALEGFVRSLAKELGSKGATVNLLLVRAGAETRMEGPLRWLCSERAAFVTGQVIEVSKTVKGTLPHAWTQPLRDKVAVVTGAARGIGARTAHALAAEGAKVIGVDRPADLDLLQDLTSRIDGEAIALDVTDDDAPRSLAEALSRDHGGVDIVVHNAGVTRDKTLVKMSPEQWDQAVGVNLVAVTRLTSPLLEGVLRGGGRIVCLSSIAGIAGNFGQTNYAASKAGIIGYVRALSGPLAKEGITVNAIAPGFIETRLTEAIPVMNREVGRRMNALSQGGLPQDIAEAVTFLASPDAAGITGGVLRVCGGNLVGA